jgi:protein-L-isoaspartate(D-aspartate) O-methyltransferase
MGDRQLADQLRERGIEDGRVLEAIASLSRADFVPGASPEEATSDNPIPIGFGQTISQPYIVAFMSQALQLRGPEHVLEIGTGSGYQTAVLARLCAEVYTVEIVPELATSARERLERLGLTNVHLREGDGYLGWQEAAPFQGILLTAAPPEIPDALLAQLAPMGRLVAPVGAAADAQELILIEKQLLNGGIRIESLLPVRFVPMTGGTGVP